MRRRPRHPKLPIIGFLLAALSYPGGRGAAAAFITPIDKTQKCQHRNQKNFWASAPTRIPCPIDQRQNVHHRRPSSSSTLYYRNPNDVIRGGSHLITVINSPGELAAFLDTRDIDDSSSTGTCTGSDPTTTATDLRVVNVYASWCLGCKAFDTRYRKLANQHRGPDSDVYGGFNRVRFAEIEFGSNEFLCRELGATRMPYVLIYRTGDPHDEPREGFVCPPREIDRVREAVNRHIHDDGTACWTH
mmetsp:Transcript_2713/g.7963  ORF Transcript_2713/g.7963 Transcript_2713/m.7963 type:complete len:245 (+) Transcript_2713:53-787(+)